MLYLLLSKVQLIFYILHKDSFSLEISLYFVIINEVYNTLFMLYSSKENTDCAVNTLTKFLQLSNINNEFMGGMVAMFHIIFGLYTLKSICFNKIDSMFKYIIFTWVIIIFSNYYFHGCILTRLERSFTNNKNWYGPTSLLFNVLKIEQNKQNANNCIKYFVVFPFSSILIVRLLLSKNYYLFYILFFLLTPLLFIQSQALLFQKQQLSTSIRLKDINKNIVVSGASSGIGLALVKYLLQNKANVICLMRNSKHAEDNYNSLNNIYGDRIHWVKADFTSLKSINAAIGEIKLVFKEGVDVLFNNAGISNTTPQLTVDGYEAQIQTNCISHIALTEGLLSVIKKRNGIIINNSSISYNIPSNLYNPVFFKTHANLDCFNSLFMTQHLYQQSKMGLLLYTCSLQNRLKDSNVNVISFHPGVCKTNLLSSSILPSFIINLIELFADNVNTVIPCLIDIINSSDYKDPLIIYGHSNILIDKCIVNNIQTDLFEKDVVLKFAH
jgi:NAD(P)-dependent dehydrogenase (short-subunit alcohol dehydrogenase family)